MPSLSQTRYNTGKLGKAVPTLQKQAISISLEIVCLALLGKHPQAPLIAGKSLRLRNFSNC
jgi:hypothetical protein